MVEDVDGYILTGSINRKYFVKVRPFSSAKSTDIKDYVKPRNFDPSLYILPTGTNDLSLEDSPETIVKLINETTAYLKAETNNTEVSNIIARADKNKEKVEN